jgi:pilus assembly protein CpaE
VARASYDAIVVDTSPFFHGAVLATLDRTDQLLVLCGLDVPTLKNVRLALQTLEQLSFPANRITYVMNRASANVGLKTREVEDGLHVKVAHELPLDRTVQVCVNRGESAVLVQPRSDFARAMNGLVKQMAPKVASTNGAAPRKRLLSFARA